jgi:hypothetical protein
MRARDAAVASTVGISLVLRPVLSVVIHIWTVVLASQLCGFWWCGFGALCFPVISEVLVAVRLWSDYGLNFYCVAVVACAGLWVIGWLALIVSEV